jgi:hypothetical protein
MDRLTKTAHFLPVKIDFLPPQYAKKYITEIVRLHGILKTIASDRGPQFTAHFWEHLHKGLGTSLIRSTAYHPQIDGQTERVNVVLEDMLRACVLSSRGSWESWLPLADFSYNNSYQESIKMAPFEALYDRKCRTPLNWVKTGERRYYGVDFIEEAENKVHIIQQNMKMAQSRQKSYADRRRPLVFEVGDYVYLKVTPMKKRFGVQRKLAARFVGPYKILERRGLVAYKLELPEIMSTVFLVFHVSQLKKCLLVPEERIEPQGIKLKLDLVYHEQPVRVLDTKERATQNGVVKTYKIQWSHHDEGDATWETGEYLQKTYEDFYNTWFVTQISGRDFYKGVGCNTLVLRVHLALQIIHMVHHLHS